jgi:hypothetical protein
MNTSFLMTASAVAMGLAGIGLTFLPAEIAAYVHPAADGSLSLVMQITGALYFAFAMLNWMAKGSRIGGIYNRPIAIANFTHFLVGALALLKAFPAQPGTAPALLIATGLYCLFALLFGLTVFRHPIPAAQVN